MLGWETLIFNLQSTGSVYIFSDFYSDTSLFLNCSLSLSSHYRQRGEASAFSPLPRDLFSQSIISSLGAFSGFHIITGNSVISVPALVCSTGLPPAFRLLFEDEALPEIIMTWNTVSVCLGAPHRLSLPPAFSPGLGAAALCFRVLLEWPPVSGTKFLIQFLLVTELVT